MQFDNTLNSNGNRQTFQVNEEEHLLDLIKQVLFTSPGERVNQPTFGCGLRQLIFTPYSEELATAIQYLVKGSLQQWLGDFLQVEKVKVEGKESTIEVTIKYMIRRTQVHKEIVFPV
jgi:phage baseplate assembly protein W